VVQVFLETDLHACAPFASAPHKQVSQWGLYQFHFKDGTRSRHLVGWCNGRGRVSTALVL